MAEAMSRPTVPPMDFESGNVAETWKRWRQTMRLMLDGPLAGKSEKAQCSYFLLYIGQTGRDIYNTWTLTADEMNKIQVLFDKFESHCNPKQNIAVSRYKFNTRVQQPSETIDQFVTDLRTLALDTAYGDLTEEMIRDRILYGSAHHEVKEKLLQETEPSLAKYLDIARSVEMSKKHMADMSQPTEAEKHVAALHSRKPPSANKARYRKGQSSKVSNFNPCSKCGRKHKLNNCPAFGKTCYKCQGRNHFAPQCKARLENQKSVHTLENEDTDSDDEFFIGSIDKGKGRDEVYADLTINGSKLSTKLDTGAQVNVIPENEFSKLNKMNPIKLQPNDAKLSAYGGHVLKVVGKCQLKVDYKQHSKKLVFYVVEANAPVTLSFKACTDLELIKVIMQVEKTDLDNADGILSKYNDVFTGLGCMEEQYDIKLKPDANPVVHPARRVPVALREKLKQELERMEAAGVIARVSEATPWVNSMVVVHKQNGQVRICLDPKDLNNVILREHYTMPTLGQVTSQLADQKLFTVLDAKSGFWQVPLSHESSLLTCFNSPIGRYRFLRLPFGLNSSQEVFQKRMEQAFEGIDGVHILVDDLLVTGRNREEHDLNLETVLCRARDKNIKLNPSKIQLRKSSVKFFGELITSDGLKPDPSKVQAIRDMRPPADKKQLECYLGMFNYLAQYAPNLSQKTAVLRELLKTDSNWSWGPEYDKVFEDVKNLITSEPGPVLQYYDVQKPVVLQVDASQHGLGAVLLQDGRPVAYASKALTSTQQNYAQIEKEALSIVYGCEKFHQYLFGRHFEVHNDHKPLESIMKKPLHAVPLRLQRMRIRLQMYDLNVVYKPGTQVQIADALSRHHSSYCEDDDMDIDKHVQSVIKTIPVSSEKLSEIALETQKDTTLSLVTQIVLNGWPDSQSEVPVPARSYWNFRDELSFVSGVLYKGERIVIPTVLRQQLLNRLHTGHMGIEKCPSRARDVMFWPKMSSDIENLVSKCSVCQKHRKSNPKEPLINHDIPSRPWQTVGTDLFVLENKNYVIIVDYFSRFFEFAQLPSLSASAVITQTKSIFARHGVPIISDNGPQFSSAEYADFTEKWGITLTLVSPYTPQSNGLAEKACGIVKALLTKCKESKQDPYLALLNYRNTPLDGVASPAQLLMNRRLRDVLPTSSNQLQPKIVSRSLFQSKRQKSQRRQKKYYDRTTQSLPPIQPGNQIRIQQSGKWNPATVIRTTNIPRSYCVRTPDGVEYRRNRRHLIQDKSQYPVAADVPARTVDQPHNTPNLPVPDKSLECQIPQQCIKAESTDSHPVITRSGRVVKPKHDPDFVKF